MQHAAPPPPLRAASQLLIAGDNIAGDRVLKTLVLAVRRLGLPHEFRLGRERGGHRPMNRLVCVAGTQPVKRVAGRDDDGVGGVVAVINKSTAGWAPDDFVLADKLRGKLLEVPVGKRRLPPRVQPQ